MEYPHEKNGRPPEDAFCKVFPAAGVKLKKRNYPINIQASTYIFSW